MDGKTLMAAMSYPGYDAPLSLDRYTALVPVVEAGLRRAQCTSQPRISMALAQLGAESGSLQWSEELADGTEYNMRADLGNTQPGDGPRFKGRSFIQITGRAHYANLSQWAFQHGYVPSATYFISHPEQLAADKYVMLGFVWYWTVARPQMNALADRGDIKGATFAVNGGYSNLSGRTARWNKCKSLGNALLLTQRISTPAVTISEDDEMLVDSDQPDNNPVLVLGSYRAVLGHQKSIDAFKAAGIKLVVISHSDYLNIRKGAVQP